MHLILLLNMAIHSCYIGSKVVLALLALELGAGEIAIGLLISCYAVAPMALGIYAGRLADTIGMRIPMLAGSGLIGAAMLVGYLWQSLPALFAVALMVGAGFVFFNISIQNLTGAISAPPQRARNYSTLSVSYSFSNFLGPMIAGYSIEYAGHDTAFLIFGVFTLVPLVALALRGRLAQVPLAAPEGGQRSTLALLREAPLRRLVLMSGLIVASWELYVFYVPIFAHGIGLPPSTTGLILGAYAVATFAIRFALPLIMRRLRIDQVLALSSLVAAAAFVAFPFLRDPYLLMAASFVIGLGLGCGQPLSMTLSYDRAPPGRTGEVTGLRLIANNTARVIVPVLSGALGTAFGTTPVFWLNALNLVAVSYLARR